MRVEPDLGWCVAFGDPKWDSNDVPLRSSFAFLFVTEQQGVQGDMTLSRCCRSGCCCCRRVAERRVIVVLVSLRDVFGIWSICL